MIEPSLTSQMNGLVELFRRNYNSILSSSFFKVKFHIFIPLARYSDMSRDTPTVVKIYLKMTKIDVYGPKLKYWLILEYF